VYIFIIEFQENTWYFQFYVVAQSFCNGVVFLQSVSSSAGRVCVMMMKNFDFRMVSNNSF
jgi:hypothetical protein